MAVRMNARPENDMTSENTSIRATALTIACTDPNKSERFYRGALGATPEPRDGYGCRWYRLGPMLINLMPNATERSPARFPTHAMPILYLEVDDLQATYQRLLDNGVDVAQPSDGQSMMVVDPDGLLIEVWQAE